MFRTFLAAVAAASLAVAALAQTEAPEAVTPGAGEAAPQPTPVPLTEEERTALDAALAECRAAAEPDARFALCDELIASGKLAGTPLAEAYIARGEARQLNGSYLPAISDYEKALEHHPGHPVAYLRRGQALDLMGRSARALEDLDYALLLQPGYPDALRSRAIVYCRLGRFEESVADRLVLIEDGLWPAEDAQQWLAGLGYYDGPVDGNFGPASEAALLTWTEQGCPRP